MRFGDPTEFAIDAFHEPAGPEWAGFGRMCIYFGSTPLGELSEEHCSLFHAADRFRELGSAIESLWDDSFAGLADADIFSLLDDALYVGSESQWERYGRFNFLTGTGEQFNDFKTFIVCSPDQWVRILWQSHDGKFTSGACSTALFRDVANAFVVWFNGQIEQPRQLPIQAMQRSASRSESIFR